jgi:hypothetical protein
MRDQHGHRRAGFYRRVRPAQFDPRHVKHFPLPDGALCALKNIGAFAQLNAVVIDVISVGRAFACRSDVSVGELLACLCGKKLADVISIWF